MARHGELHFLTTSLAIVSITTLIGSLVHGFNMDLQAPVVQRISETDSYFGYSVAMHRENGMSKILVGAPTFQTANANVNRSGALFSCPVTPYTNPGSCLEITQFSDYSTDVDEYNDPIATMDHQWLGAIVRSSGIDGRVLVCRPLYTWYVIPETTAESTEREPIGGCFVAMNNFTTIQAYEPCRTMRRAEQSVFGIGHCQAGIGADITEDEILLGAPGSFFWQGQIWVASVSDLSSPRKTKEGPFSFDDSYRGYSVAMGDFTGDPSPEYAVGIPRAKRLLGLVSIYDATMNAYLNFTGSQFGAYFGHTLVVSDLNCDGRDDIVVSAPFYIDEEKTVDGWEIGRVHIYYNDANGGFSDGSTIVGYGVRSRFGSAMAALSDINQDGCNDLAISAPYGGTQNAGAVYIYHGGRRGLSPTPSQVLEPSSFGLDLKTFGYSLSAGLDMDENMYPDLLIGAYESATVVLVRSRPIIDVSTRLIAAPEAISLQNTTFTYDNPSVASFNLSVCMTYMGNNVPATLDFNYTVLLDFSRQTSSRALFALSGTDATSVTASIDLQFQVEKCHILPAYVQSTIRDKLSPISISVSFGLSDGVPENGSILPILAQSISTYSTISVPIQRNCQNQTCIPNLYVEASTGTEALRVGASESVSLDVTIGNRGEDSYLSVLDITLPEELQYVGFEKIEGDSIVTCTSQSSTAINCDVGNPLRAGTKVKMSIRFSSESMPGNGDSVLFTFAVRSADQENVISDNEYNVSLPLLVTAVLSLHGSSNPTKVIYNVEDYPITNIQYEGQIGPEVTHVFSLYNNGPSRIGETVVTIPWPTRNGAGSDGYLLYPISATMDTGDECAIEMGWNPENITLNGTIGDVTSSNSRRRRETVINVPPDSQTTTAMPPSTAAPRNVECISTDSSHCYAITCAVDSLGAGINAARNNLAITVRSLLWSNSITIDETQTSTEVFVTVQAKVEVLSTPYTTPLTQPIEATSNEVETSINPQVTTGGIIIKEVPLWVYLVSAIGGVVILLIMILILYKVGFFKKKKVTQDEKNLIRSKSVSHPSKGEYNQEADDN